MALKRIFQFAAAFKNIGIQSFQHVQLSRPLLTSSFHTTTQRLGLDEFFENEKNWKKDKIQVGRSWKVEELRLKSNTDLHKLWYVLLKERNMLMTMEHYYKEMYIVFPNPERIDKVQDSMKNLEEVVRERNRAYHQLETGESGERPGELVDTQLGTRFFYRKFQHAIPKFMNTKWRRHHKHYYDTKEVGKFQQLMKEKAWNEKRRKRNRDRQAVIQILKRWPDVDPEALKEKYPDQDIEQLKTLKGARPHAPPE